MNSKIKEYLFFLYLALPFIITFFILDRIYLRFLFPILLISLIIKLFKKGKISKNIILIIYMLFIIFTTMDLLLILFQGNSFDLKSIELFTFDSLIAGINQFTIYSILIGIFFVLIILGINYFIKFIVSNNQNKTKRSIIYNIVVLLLVFITPNSFSFFINKLIAYSFYKQNLQNNIQLPKIKLQAKAGNNLILIYLESFETEYTEKKYFPNLTPFLQTLKKQDIEFDKNYMIDGANFSIAGMFTSQCGAPFQYRNTKNLLCLGDILHKANYFQVFMQGSDMSFEKMGKYYKKHGYNELYGKKELVPIGDKYKVNDWGTTDEDLFTYAYKKWKELHINYIDKKIPYNLTLFTSDTHNGQPSPSCPKYNGLYEENHFFQSYHCTDYLVKNFINKIMMEKKDDNITIALIGDHLQHFDVYASKLKNMDRRVYIAFYPTKENTHISYKTSHVDFAPTLLDILNIDHNVKFLFGRDMLLQENQKNMKLIKNTKTTSRKLYNIINANLWIETLPFYSPKKEIKKKKIKDLFSFGAGIKNISKKELNKYFLPDLKNYKNFSSNEDKVYYSDDDDILFIKTKKYFNDIHLKFKTDNNYYFDGNISASKAIDLGNNWYAWVFRNRIKNIVTLKVKILEVKKEDLYRDGVLIKEGKNYIDFIVRTHYKNKKIAFYLYNDKGVKLDVKWYGNDFKYRLNKNKFQKGCYRIRYFLVDKDSENPSKAIKIDGYSKYINLENKHDKKEDENE